MLSPGGVELRGFSGKSILADQRNLVGEARVVIDVGAYDGAITAEYLEVFPKALCHALEPHPATFGELAGRFRGNPRARVHRLALSDTVGKGVLHAFPTPATNSLLAPVANVADVVGRGHMDSVLYEDVEVTTLDVFAAGVGLSHIDVLKLDVQGAEVLVLRGAHELLRRQAIGLVVTEVNFVPVYQLQAFYYDVAVVLAEYGYRLYDYYNFHYGPGGQLHWGDAIFVA